MHRHNLCKLRERWGSVFRSSFMFTYGGGERSRMCNKSCAMWEVKEEESFITESKKEKTRGVDTLERKNLLNQSN